MSRILRGLWWQLLDDVFRIPPIPATRCRSCDRILARSGEGPDRAIGDLCLGCYTVAATEAAHEVDRAWIEAEIARIAEPIDDGLTIPPIPIILPESPL